MVQMLLHLKQTTDFVIITHKFICILETKKLNGDITINNQGEFIRAFKSSNGKVCKKEGMYSPISQNQRHVRILQDMFIKEKVIKSRAVISLVMMANPKNIIDFKFAPKEIKQQIVKYDQLTPFLKHMITKKNEVDLSIVSMQNIADVLLKQHVEGENTFVNKYDHLRLPEKEGTTATIIKETLYVQPVIEQEVIKESSKPLTTNNAIQSNKSTNVGDAREKLITFRKLRAKEEGVAAYYIFNNNQMEDLISKMPKSKSELNACNGFGPVKTEKYGDQIISIFLEC